MKIHRVSDLLKEGKTLFSFEYFPPKTPKGWESLLKTIGQEMIPLRPAYVSVTYGAGGSTRENTHRLVTRIQDEFGLTVVAHLTCTGSTREDVDRILDSYKRGGVKNILALRGDPPKTFGSEKAEAVPDTSAGKPGPVPGNISGAAGLSGAQNPATTSADKNSASSVLAGDFPHAADLVSYIRRKCPDFSIGVAGFPEGHPDTPNRILEIENMKAKVDAGADYIVTQLFFDNRDYFDYTARLRLAGITVPVVPGIMPVSSLSGIRRMGELAAGARFPAPLLRAVSRAADDEGVAQVGIHWATAQIADLLNGEVPGIHLYTLNHSRATIQICRNMGLHTF